MKTGFGRRLGGSRRSRQANRQLGISLAWVAGAANAGGFLAVQQYTSHMTGIVSAMADELVLGQLPLVLAGLASLLSFIMGAAVSAFLINWARTRRMHSEFALALMLEAVLMLFFGLLGAYLHTEWRLVVPATVILLCFMMGLQNAIITKISQAEIRTTHVTGVVTDIGIALGRLLFWAVDGKAVRRGPWLATRRRLQLHGALLLAFVLGGMLGAYAFKALGFMATVPLALLLMALSVMPIWDDLRQAWRSGLR